MAVHDIESELTFSVALAAVISANGTVSGEIIDTAHYELGFVGAADVTAYTDGDHEVQLFESDDSGMSGATQVLAPKILPTTNTSGVLTLSAAVAAGDVLEKIGAFSTKRYLQFRIVSTSVTTGATLRINVAQRAELRPE